MVFLTFTLNSSINRDEDLENNKNLDIHKQKANTLCKTDEQNRKCMVLPK